MEYLAVAVAGSVALLLVTWTVHIALGRATGRVTLSSDEKVALQRADEVAEAYVDDTLAEMGRLEVWRRIYWIWKSVRATAMHSGRWSALPWLLLFGGVCAALSLKTLLIPDSRNLRLLLAGREFIDFFLVSRRSRSGRDC